MKKTLKLLITMTIFMLISCSAFAATDTGSEYKEPANSEDIVRVTIDDVCSLSEAEDKNFHCKSRFMLDNFFTENWLPRRFFVHDTFKVDVEVTDKKYLVLAELPGIQKNEIGLRFDNGRLIISVNREQRVNEEKKYLHHERHFTSMTRNIYLADAKADGIKAKLKDGVLTVIVPKQEKSNNQVSIDIE